ncbi:MAG: chromosomal replication initiator protein DnaA [Candidatus Dojkabacteria bacterium]|nr:MAG: chromosomal replication initiator protein DnaA [Candidatus Dojkabacteria bacterium]
MPMNIKDKNQLWKTVLAQIEIKLDAPAQFKTFFQDTKLIDLQGNKAVIGVINPYTAEWLKAKHEKLIKDTISYVYGEELKPEFHVYQDTNIKELEKEFDYEEAPLLATQHGVLNSVIDEINKAGLNTKYSFSNFIVGNPNRIAHAAALAVVDNLGAIYNPLFIYGPTGVGKTHLAQAIGRAVLERNIAKKIKYTPSEGFLNDMVKAIKTRQQEKFRAIYRPLDILIIDDMQLISKWVATQEEFFNTFNELYNAGKQIIMIADRKPDDIKNLESRLRSRMQGGMVVEIAKPDFEMRLAIAQQKAESSGFDISKQALEFIARSITDNVRALEGAIQKVALFNQMKPNGHLTLEEIAHTLNIDSQSKRNSIKISTVLKEVAKEFNVSVKELKGPKRTKDVALARQVAMYILREEFDYKLEDIARFLNRKDHTTVMHAVDKIKSKTMIQDGFHAQISKIISAINESSMTDEEL